MATLEDIRRELDKDELDYPLLARTYGESALPHLKTLVIEDEPRIASKAAYLAGVIGGDHSGEVVALSARSRHDVIRVAAAAVVGMLPLSHAIDIALLLLNDPDPGVRIRAAKSSAKLETPALATRLRDMSHNDPDPHVRDLTRRIVESLN